MLGIPLLNCDGQFQENIYGWKVGRQLLQICRISTRPKCGITLDQSQYVEDLEIEDINPQRAMHKDHSLSSEELTLLRSLVGKLNWLVQGTRMDLAFELVELSTEFRKGLVSDLVREIKCVKKLKMECAKIVFSNLGTPNDWTIYVFSDAALANLCDGFSSMGAHLVLLVGPDGLCCPLAWHAGKIKRVVRSTIAAEAMSLQEGADEAVYVRGVILELLGLPLPVKVYTDNRSVVEAIQSTKMVADKRLRLNISAIRQLVQYKSRLSS